MRWHGGTKGRAFDLRHTTIRQYTAQTELLVTVVVIIIIIIHTESYPSLLKSAVIIKHDRSHYQMYFKFILGNTWRSRFFAILFHLPAVRSPRMLNRRSAYACDADQCPSWTEVDIKTPACVFQAPVAAVPPSGNCCQHYYRFRFGFFVFV